jgi:hypothetical protein
LAAIDALQLAYFTEIRPYNQGSRLTANGKIIGLFIQAIFFSAEIIHSFYSMAAAGT